MNSLLTNFIIFTDRITISILVIKKVLTLLLVFAIGQLLPSLSQANALYERQPVNVVSNNSFVPYVSSIIHDFDDFILSINKSVKFRMESRSDNLFGGMEPLSLSKTDSQKITDQKGSQDTEQRFERIAFYETKQFHAYVTGMVIGFILLVLCIML